MTPDEVRALFAYDRWATRKVLVMLDDIPDDLWAETTAIGDRGLGGILVHHLGASQRWRNGFQDTGIEPSPEREPLPTVDELRARWEAEWVAVDAWLPTLTDGFVTHVEEGVPVWQMLVHVVNHGTQHRAEAAALLTTAGRSPGELDLIVYAEELVTPDQPTGDA
ncbi:MAG TPA: DinB family protein [Candidatus Limnocylindrales bacterium]